MTLHDLNEKDVIQMRTGENLGRIDDFVFDETTAKIQAAVLRGRGRLFGLLGYDEDLVIPWDGIQKIGTDVIMVDAELTPSDTRSRTRQKTV